MNKYKRFWISFWYNDSTRIAVVLGVPIIPLYVCLSLIGVDFKYSVYICEFFYFSLILWAIIDNDYSNLRKIGMDEYRKPLDEN